VLERGSDVVVDEFAVDLPNESLLPTMIREIEQVDGASIEQVRLVGHFPDARLDALENATRLCEAESVESLQQLLVDTLRSEFLADWTALVVTGSVVSAAGNPPSNDLVPMLAAGATASPLVANGTTGPEDLAVAALTSHDATLVMGRDGQPFRRRERAQLLALARIADRAWGLLPPTAPAPDI
jgi:hypothetical protein